MESRERIERAKEALIQELVKANGVMVARLLVMSNRLDKKLSPMWLHLQKREIIIMENKPIQSGKIFANQI